MNEPDPTYDQELRRRLRALKAEFETGRIRIAKELADDFSKSIMAVRYGPDGEIDLDTVDARVRSMALVVTAISDRQELKKAISLHQIQGSYFDFIEKSFGYFHDEALKRGLTPARVARAVSNDPDAVATFAPQISDFVETLKSFWGECGDAALIHAEDLSGLKGCFGGDLFPSHSTNLASQCGLYLDTIVLPDPFLRSAELWKRWSTERATFYFIKHGVNLLKYKSLALAKVDPPIAIVLPELKYCDRDNSELLMRMGTDDALRFAGKTFGQLFESSEALSEFVDPLKTNEQVLSATIDKKRLLAEANEDPNPELQLKSLVETASEEYGLDPHPGHIVARSFYGRMMQANDLLMRSSAIGASPLIDAETSWRYFSWKLEQDAAEIDSGKLVPLHMVRGMQLAASGDMTWIGKIPTEALIQLKETGVAQELRNILSANVQEIATARPHSFFRTSDKIVDNLNSAFSNHEKRLTEIAEKKFKFYASDIGSWFVTGTLEVASALLSKQATGYPVIGLGKYIVGQVVEVPKLKDIPGKYRELQTEIKDVKSSPVGLLFSIAKKYQ